MTKDELIDYVSARDFCVIATKAEPFPESACIQFGNDGRQGFTLMHMDL